MPDAMTSMISGLWRSSWITRCVPLIALGIAGCALIPAQQNPLPSDVLKEMNKPEHFDSKNQRNDIIYTGEYFCEQGTTGMSLQIIGGKDANSIFAIFHFFPLASNPNVPPGSFVVKGVFDSRRGFLDMEPFSWITRPTGFVAAGLRGTSTDGGNSFEGQLTGVGFLCSTFAMRKSSIAH